ncbi:hypothetical protein L207DRAFT_578302 [Hyaloscypha variabilis F]|uniref:Uncharacterized protein n=1 Tax=Hyaloscypha variabilis (strain UAMH 11265 / GT02V1 / F) TaxID=1149755 RepID=A0A2J6S3N3_HYAVF|nr:hypothetical protein L207DRAFT_578302 [Hyaloscypha variabilis F]
MSKIRGVFPLFLATTFGIVNGIWVFQPLLAAQQEGKDDLSNLAKQALETPQPSEDRNDKTTIEAEQIASRSSATAAALKPIQPTRSWWPTTSLWSNSENAAARNSTVDDSRTGATGTSKDTKERNT